MSEFDRWFKGFGSTLGVDKGIALKIWTAAQLAAVRTLADPPYIPNVGERFVSSLFATPVAWGW